MTLVVLSLMSVGCSQNPTLEADNTTRVDFAGFWELNLAQSDNIRARLDSLVRDLREQAERRARAGSDRGGMAVGSGGANTDASIIGLARMAEMITASQLLEVVQGDNDILIKREDTFSLTCEFFIGSAEMRRGPLGTEVCGWDGHQLLFKIFLPGGLTIQHRLSLGTGGERLNIATTVFSDQVSYPFTLNRVYNHYIPDREGFSCQLTLTRGKVCTTRSQ